MNTEHIHTLIASNKELSQNYARVIKTNARAIKLIDNCLQEKDTAGSHLHPCLPMAG